MAGKLWKASIVGSTPRSCWQFSAHIYAVEWIMGHNYIQSVINNFKLSFCDLFIFIVDCNYWKYIILRHRFVGWCCLHSVHFYSIILAYVGSWWSWHPAFRRLREHFPCLTHNATTTGCAAGAHVHPAWDFAILRARLEILEITAYQSLSEPA